MKAQHTLGELDKIIFSPDYLKDDRRDNHPSSTLGAIGLGAVEYALRSRADPTKLKPGAKIDVKLAEDLANMLGGYTENVTLPGLISGYLLKPRKPKH
jgi:hypothetical protein